MNMKITVEYKGSDERVDLFVVRIEDYSGNHTYSNWLCSLERLKNKTFVGDYYADVWFCDGYRLAATKEYSVEEVIDALWGDGKLENDDDWQAEY